ncbi:biogenesis of lysosome-related organelles complex 1 subunit 1 [Acrasis kona]|uniref:Biogenesis of lysosome-related organelles complex 1 subunit 1 n=1 Tax=Acrasis kona TaxID=1008807 RepID=A0AAW2ZQI5_9EUKA
MSLSSLVKEHNQVQVRLREDNDKNRKKAKESLLQVSRELVLNTNSDVAQVFHNQQLLEAEAKQIHIQSQRLTKQTTQWLQLFQQLNASLKELGDVENWAGHIHDDVQVIVKNIDQAISVKQQQLKK